MKVEVGKKYRVKNRRGKEWNDRGLMDHFMGQIVTIQKVYCDRNIQIVEDEGENGGKKWIFESDDFEPIEEITFEEAAAKFSETVKKLDESIKNLVNAAQIAIERCKDAIAGQTKKEKLYNARIVCIEGCYGMFTKGKIYNVVDGVFKCDTGGTFPVMRGERYGSISDINKDLASKFIELVED